MKTIQKINQDYLDIWQKHAATVRLDRYPIQYDNPERQAVVFVGINPSYSAVGWRNVLLGTQHKDLDIEKFFAWPDQAFCSSLAIQLEKLARIKYSYFNPFIKFSDHIREPWINIDLFGFRETNQNDAKSWMFSSLKTQTLSPFASAQLQLFDKLLELANPKMVVVVNRLASDIYSKHRNITRNSYDHCLGCFFDKVADGGPFPVHFSGMLTGGRALDIPSRDRLFSVAAHSIAKTWVPEFP